MIAKHYLGLKEKLNHLFYKYDANNNNKNQGKSVIPTVKQCFELIKISGYLFDTPSPFDLSNRALSFKSVCNMCVKQYTARLVGFAHSEKVNVGWVSQKSGLNLVISLYRLISLRVTPL